MNEFFRFVDFAECNFGFIVRSCSRYPPHPLNKTKLNANARNDEYLSNTEINTNRNVTARAG